MEKPADSLWSNVHKAFSFTHIDLTGKTNNGYNFVFYPDLPTVSSTKLYTKITQKLLLLRAWFCTVSTWPITTTTIYIIRKDQ